jgi:hypothetical protein
VLTHLDERVHSRLQDFREIGLAIVVLDQGGIVDGHDFVQCCTRFAERSRRRKIWFGRLSAVSVSRFVRPRRNAHEEIAAGFAPVLPESRERRCAQSQRSYNAISIDNEEGEQDSLLQRLRQHCLLAYRPLHGDEVKLHQVCDSVRDDDSFL